MNWTQEQKKAIQYDENAPLLVSAAAGSGKTAVLIERIFERVMSGKTEPENILVMTFTDKAAAQMKQKIDQKIATAIAEAKDPAELGLLRDIKKRFPLAQISTIHAFCLQLIRQYGAFLTDEQGELLLNPGFSVITETHAQIYLDQAIEEVLTFLYGKLANLTDETESDPSQPITRTTENVPTPVPAINRTAETETMSDFSRTVTKNIPGLHEDLKIFTLLDQEISETEWLDDFQKLTFILSDYLIDDNLKKTLAQSWKKLKSIAYFEAEIRNALQEKGREAADFGQSDSAREILDELQEKTEVALAGISLCQQTEFYNNLQENKKPTKEGAKLLESLPLEEQIFRQIKETLASGLTNREKWNRVFELSENLSEPNYLRSAYASPAGQIKAEFMEIYEPSVLPAIALIHGGFNTNSAAAMRNHLENAQPFFAKSIEQIEQDLCCMLPPLARFFELIVMIDRSMLKLKQKYNKIDYHDFEHFALRLLDQPAISRSVHRQYQEIYLDEYQDTNPIQETIVRKIDCARTFMVGDLKQSIYRFRHADPTLFRDKLEAWPIFSESRKDLSEGLRDSAEGAENSFELQMDSAEGQEASAELPQDLADEQAVSDDLQENSDRRSERDSETNPATMGNVILLNQNFRSAETVLAGINELFSWFMKKEIAEIDYDAKQRLAAGNSSLKEEKIGTRRIEFQQITLEEDSLEKAFQEIPELNNIPIESNTDKNIIAEALQAVLRIRREIEAGRHYGDFAILGRTNRICRLYGKVLEVCSIPYSGGIEKNYLDTTELRFLEQLIQFLDNSRQDIPLASLMRSSIFNLSFSEEELLLFRILRPDTRFFYEVIEEMLGLNAEEFVLAAGSVFRQYKTSEELLELHRRLTAFAGIVADLREKSYWFTISELLDYIFAIADYPGQLAGLPFAEQRLADITKFQEWVTTFEKEQGGGLHQFVLLLEQINQHKLELENFNIAPAPGNSVSIMTIHAAKGLEYPFVILGGANYDLFSRLDDPIIAYDPHFGIASYTADPDQQIVYANPPLLRYRQKNLDREWAEAYRLLYVAMTRAEEKLLILSHVQTTLKKANRTFNESALYLRKRMDLESMQNLKSYAEILMAYFCTKEISLLDYFTAQRIPDREFSLELENYAVKIFRADYFIENIRRQNERLKRVTANESAKRDQSLPNPEIILDDAESRRKIERIRALLEDLNADDPLNLSPAKLTVSEIKSAALDLTDQEEGVVLPVALADMGYSLRNPVLSQDVPVDLSSQDLVSGTEFGTYIHQLMQYLSLTEFFAAAESAWEDIYRKQLMEMIRQKKMPEHPHQMQAAYPLVAVFLRSDLARRVNQAELKQAPVYRELPFTLAVPAITVSGKTIVGVSAEEKTLVQGMIDLWFMEGEKAILVDYKSDFIAGDRAAKQKELERRYQLQLDYYALALERIIGLKEPVQEKYIWLLRDGEVYYL